MILIGFLCSLFLCILFIKVCKSRLWKMVWIAILLVLLCTMLPGIFS